MPTDFKKQSVDIDTGQLLSLNLITYLLLLAGSSVSSILFTFLYELTKPLTISESLTIIRFNGNNIEQYLSY